jgi:hypothetical protein
MRGLRSCLLKYEDEGPVASFAGTDRFITDANTNRRDVDRNERRNGAAERWLDWLSGELARRERAAGPRLLVLWDVLEEWFSSEDFQGRVAGSLIGGIDLPGPGHPEHAAVAANRNSLRRLLEGLASEVGAPDPTELASQLQMLFEGAVVGALIDGQPQVAQAARQLAMVALAASTGSRGLPPGTGVP